MEKKLKEKNNEIQKVIVSNIKDYTSIFTKIFYVLIAIAIILGLMLIVNIVSINNNTSNNVATTDEEEASGEYDVSMFTEMSTTEALNKIAEKGTEIVYIGRSTCGYCVKFLPTLQQAQTEYGYNTIYIDLEQMSSDDQTNILTVDNDEGYIEENLGYTPMVLVFKDGKLSQGWVGYAEYDSFASFLEDNGFSK